MSDDGMNMPTVEYEPRHRRPWVAFPSIGRKPLWIAAVVVAAMVATGWYFRPTPIDKSKITWYHNDADPVYGLPGSQLVHFGECDLFKPEMSRVGTTAQVKAAYLRKDPRLQLCPHCMHPMTDPATGRLEFGYHDHN